jgi:hypothetical protein
MRSLESPYVCTRGKGQHTYALCHNTLWQHTLCFMSYSVTKYGKMYGRSNEYPLPAWYIPSTEEVKGMGAICVRWGSLV